MREVQGSRRKTGHYSRTHATCFVTLCCAAMRYLPSEILPALWGLNVPFPCCAHWSPARLLCLLVICYNLMDGVTLAPNILIPEASLVLRT